MMRAAIYDPYLDSLGGGERYAAIVAQTLLQNNWQVDLLWHDNSVIQDFEKRFAIDLKKVNVVPDFFTEPLFKKIIKSRSYDLIFYISNGSIPTLNARKNWLHLQVPFTHVGGHSWKNKLKLSFVDRVIVNSQFTKNVTDQEYGVKSQIIYPPVDTDKFVPGTKNKSILYVGRFSRLLQGKQHNLLIETFSKFTRHHPGWELILAGGAGVGSDGSEISQLKKQASGLPVKFVFNPDFGQLTRLYSESTFFWAAGGYGQNPNQHPERVEHFGISLVEAMSSGSVPLAVRLGGYTEILAGDLAFLLWDNPDELISKTSQLLKDPKRLAELKKNVRTRALDFASAKFKMAIEGALRDDFS